MKLESLEYSQYANGPKEWKLSKFVLGSVNLLVGRNASGKTKVLNIINNLAGLLAGDNKLAYISGDFNVVFKHQGATLNYRLTYSDAKITSEQFIVDGKKYLKRGRGGKGKIYQSKVREWVEFQAPENELAAVARRDTIQHPFFLPLYQWAKSVRYFAFGTSMGKDVIAVLDKNEEVRQKSKDTLELSFKDRGAVHKMLRVGLKQYGQKFKKAILNDMAKVGYRLKEVGLKVPSGMVFSQPPPGEIMVLFVRERDLRCDTEQNEISQGMFRALSIIIQLNYSERAGLPTCILIDDIGEGLDFERACSLIDLIMKKAQRSTVQLIMSTNDRFVMNKVPLTAWSVLDRKKGRVQIYNYLNSRKIFDDFKFTGMSNFDFLATNYLLEAK